jgi:murein DD-endopeptidase MepM/ murein hydrolase activator NlpD
MGAAAPAAVALVAVALAGCPHSRASFRPPPIPLAPAEHHEEAALAGVVHVVRRGETLYRIARAYGIDPADLMETNGISDPRLVPAGAEIFVPGAARVIEIPPGPVPLNAGAQLDPSPPTSPSTSTSTPTPTPTSTSTSTSARAPATALTGAAAGRARSGDAPLAWPLRGVLYGRYGVRDGRRHDGVDIAAPEGATVSAAAAGTVIYAGEQAGYGAIVIVRHEAGLVTLYAHNSAVLVEEGDHVARGEPVARVGQTGRTTGPHLHFEVREGARPRNPLLFLP